MEIKAGDLVMVVRLRKCGHGKLGAVIRVMAVEPAISGRVSCPCGDTQLTSTVLLHSPKGHNGGALELWRVIKIDPPATGDEVSTRLSTTPELGLVDGEATAK